MQKRPTMKRLLIISLSILALFLNTFTNPCFANFSDYMSCVQPYFGGDAGIRHVNYGGGGDKLFKTNLPQAQIYAGLRFNDFVGVEAGYKFSVLKSQFVTLTAGDLVLGPPVAFPPEYYIAKSEFKGWFGSLVGYIPCPCCIDIIGSIGFIRLKTYHYQALLVDQDGEPNVPHNFLNTGRSFKTDKTLLTLGLGIQYIYCDTVGLRFKIDWENTSQINNVKPIERPNSAFTLTSRNSLSYNIGIFFPF